VAHRETNILQNEQPANRKGTPVINGSRHKYLLTGQFDQQKSRPPKIHTLLNIEKVFCWSQNTGAGLSIKAITQG
jgi:hypothetical protein